MEILSKVVAFWGEHQVMILGIALGVSEALGSVNWFKSNSIFQWVVNTLKNMKAKKEGELK